MGPVGHTTLSTGVGVSLWAATGEWLTLPVTYVTGVLIDGDHIFEMGHWMLRGWRKYMIVPLHSWEISVALLVAVTLWYSPLFLAAAVGQIVHVTTDHLANEARPMSYFGWYRIKKRFLYKYLVADSLNVPMDEIPFWGHVEPWLFRIVYNRRAKKLASQSVDQGKAPLSKVAGDD